MFLMVLLLILAFVDQGLLYYFSNWYTSWAWCWTWLVMPFLFFWGLFAIYIVSLFVIAEALKNKEYPDGSRAAQWVCGQTAFVLCLFFRIRVHASGLGKLPGHHKRFMMVHNHLSTFDEFPMMFLFYRHAMRYISKTANLSIPIAGPWMKAAGTLPIEQNDLVGGAKVIEHAASIIQSGRNSICVCPEGTRNKTFPDPIMLPFKPGTFNLAKQAHCPIVVLAIQNSNAVIHRFPLHHTDYYLDVVAVIDEEDVEKLTTKELADLAQSAILKRFDEKGARFYHLDPKKKKEGETPAAK